MRPESVTRTERNETWQTRKKTEFFIIHKSFHPQHMSKFRGTILNDFKNVRKRKSILYDVKSVDSLIGDVFGAQTGVIENLTGINRGTSIYERIGNDITWVSIELSLRFMPNINGRNLIRSFIPWSMVTASLVYDKQGGDEPDYIDVYRSRQFTGVVSTGVHAGVNLENSRRFLVLKKWKFLLPAFRTDDKGTISQILSFQNELPILEWYGRTVEGLNATFEPNTDAPIKGAIFFAIISELADAESVWRYDGIARLRYIDSN